MARAYDHVLKPIIESIEKDNLPPWRKCWDGGIQIRPKNHSGTPYKGGNVISLWVASMIHGFTSPYWFTFNQGVKTNGWALKPNDDPKKAEPGRSRTGPKKRRMFINLPSTRMYSMQNSLRTFRRSIW